MSYITYISFSKELNGFCLSDIRGREKEFGINYDTSNFRNDIILFPSLSPQQSCVVVLGQKAAVFDSCFKNPFIYRISVQLPLNTHLHSTQIKLSELQLKKLECEKWLLYKEKLYGFISLNAKIGEFVEIYTEMTNHIDSNFGPPILEHFMYLYEFLDLKMPNEYNKHKLTIFI